MENDRSSSRVGDSMPGCPRCGYPLEGAASGWSDRCPLRHTCTECGLEIDLVRLLGRDQGSRWFVAAGRTHWARLRRTPGTMVRLAVPFWPWQTLSIEDLRRFDRPWFPASWVLGLLVLVLASSGVAMIVEESSRFVHDLRGLSIMRSSSLAKWRSAVDAGWTPDHGVSSTGWRQTPPLEVRRRNSEEVIAWWRDPLAPWTLAARLVVDRVSSDWGLGGGGITYVDEAPIGDTRMLTGIRPGRALKFPNVVTHFIGDECRISILWAHPVDLPPGPVAARKTGWDRAFERLGQGFLRLVEPLEPLRTVFAAITVTPVVFVVLPWTRRRARLDRSLLLRLSLLTLAVPAAWLCAMAIADQPLLDSFRSDFTRPRNILFGRQAAAWSGISGFLLVAGSFFGWMWWWGACRMLRLPRPAIVAAGVFLVALLAMMLVVPPDFRIFLMR